MYQGSPQKPRCLFLRQIVGTLSSSKRGHGEQKNTHTPIPHNTCTSRLLAYCCISSNFRSAGDLEDASSFFAFGSDWSANSHVRRDPVARGTNTAIARDAHQQRHRR